MAERATAQGRLERILHILPAAAREGGVSLERLEDELGVPREQILDDLGEVTAREYYHPAGGADTLQIDLGPDRISVRAGDDFRRPPRLSLREALALGLALRARAVEREDERREALLALARRLESELATASPEEFLPRFSLDDGIGAGGAVRGFLRDAIEERRRCRIRYLKRGGEAPTDRVICPYVLVFAEGVWYTIGYCTLAEDMRVFRLDRVLAAEPAAGSFDVPDDFDPADYVGAGGRLYYAEDDVEVAVRYSPAIARWIAERERFELLEDDSIVVRHRVADPGWLVRHVLRYAAAAEVLEPDELRGLVAAAAERCAE